MTPFSLLYGRGGQNQRKPCANLLRKLSRRDDEWYVVSASGTVVPDNTADSPARCDKRSQTSTKIHVGKGESQRSELEMDWPRARRTCFNLIAPIWRCRFRKLDTCASMVKAAKNRMRQMSPDRSIGRVLGQLPADPHDHASGNRWAPCSPSSRKSKTCSRPHRSNALDQAAGLGNFAQAAGVGPKTIRLHRVPQLAVGWPVTRS